jgi:hypothetical protein
MNKKYEMEILLTGSIMYLIILIIFTYLELGVIWQVLFFLASYGIIGLYYYNKETKEKEEKGKCAPLYSTK